MCGNIKDSASRIFGKSSYKKFSMEKKLNQTDDLKTDLKHDTMEFSAATDGDDQLDTDDITYEEEGITEEELNLLEDEPMNEAAALNAAETDREIDENNLPEEDWTQDLSDAEGEENINERK